MEDNKFPFAGSKFIQNLSALMKKAGDNTITLSAALGRSSSAVTHWLTGRYEPRMEMVAQIAARYGVDPLWLIGRPTEGVNDDGAPIQIAGVPHDFVEIAQSDDMAPVIPDGASVFVSKTAMIENGKIALVEVNGILMFRRVYRDDKSITLLADNTNSNPMVFTGSRRKQVSIIGRAIRVTYELR